MRLSAGKIRGCIVIYDWRTNQLPAGPPGRKPAGKVVNGKLVMRDPKDVNSLCLHQMAVTLGAAPYQVQAAKGDKDLARHLRALGVHAHVSAFTDGTVVLAYPLRAYVYHGNSANSRSIGIECEGLYNGLQGGKGAEPSETLLAAARLACTTVVELAKAEGIVIKHVVAHRQYAASRRADPGWSIWHHVAVEHCEKVLGLTPLPTLTDRDGLPIPSAWDSRQAAGY